MCQILIPQSPVVNPTLIQDNEAWNDLLESNRYNYLDLEGDYPRVGPGAQSYSGNNGTNLPPLDPNITPGPIPDNPGYERLDAVLNNVLTQDWRERGNPGNPRILECYKVCNNNYTVDGGAMTYAWCAAFVSWVLYTAGIPLGQGTPTMSSQGWDRWGGEVNWRDTSQIRKWDVIVFKSKTRSGGHIGFIQEITSNGVIKVLGGNQSDNAKVSNYAFEDRSQYVRSVKRNWSLPPEFDVPIDGTAAAQAGTDTTV
jgi:hypothetical protein